MNVSFVGSDIHIIIDMYPKSLEYLKSIGESISEEYTINWELWTDQETKNIEKRTEISLRYYEKLFNEFNIHSEKHTIQMFEDILENLISGYVIQAIIAKKKAVEDLLSAI